MREQVICLRCGQAIGMDEPMWATALPRHAFDCRSRRRKPQE